ncbi:MAG: DUF72 domain-containing protein [Clostridia bacterium]|nr:DUF72 domain-containing protein [Clostridia bacterium]MDH7572817.1 DUF72 domain-containing protein [Clostridia bacterium]
MSDGSGTRYRKTRGEGEIRVGTSGYSYRDWVGPFYPASLRPADMLAHYAREFNFVEVNFSYYRLPSARTLAGMLRKVPEGFLFTVKAYRGLTHERGPAVAEEAREFRTGLVPLLESGRLGAVLLQFPYSFHFQSENLSYLDRVRELLAGLPLVVEFRSREWSRNEVWQWLAQHNLGYVCVDGPRLRGLPGGVVQCTAPTAYVRFHGRNAGKWWDHEQAYERYDYLYSKEELKEWIPGIASLAREARAVFVAFNNHYQGQAVTNARMLRRLLEEAGLL